MYKKEPRAKRSDKKAPRKDNQVTTWAKLILSSKESPFYVKGMSALDLKQLEATIIRVIDEMKEEWNDYRGHLSRAKLKQRRNFRDKVFFYMNAAANKKLPADVAAFYVRFFQKMSLYLHFGGGITDSRQLFYYQIGEWLRDMSENRQIEFSDRVQQWQARALAQKKTEKKVVENKYYTERERQETRSVKQEDGKNRNPFSPSVQSPAPTVVGGKKRKPPISASMSSLSSSSSSSFRSTHTDSVRAQKKLNYVPESMPFYFQMEDEKGTDVTETDSKGSPDKGKFPEYDPADYEDEKDEKDEKGIPKLEAATPQVAVPTNRPTTTPLRVTTVAKSEDEGRRLAQQSSNLHIPDGQNPYGSLTTPATKDEQVDAKRSNLPTSAPSPIDDIQDYQTGSLPDDILGGVQAVIKALGPEVKAAIRKNKSAKFYQEKLPIYLTDIDKYANDVILGRKKLKTLPPALRALVRDNIKKKHKMGMIVKDSKGKKRVTRILRRAVENVKKKLSFGESPTVKTAQEEKTNLPIIKEEDKGSVTGTKTIDPEQTTEDVKEHPNSVRYLGIRNAVRLPNRESKTTWQPADRELLDRKISNYETILVAKAQTAARELSKADKSHQWKAERKLIDATINDQHYAVRETNYMFASHQANADTQWLYKQHPELKKQDEDELARFLDTYYSLDPKDDRNAILTYFEGMSGQLQRQILTEFLNPTVKLEPGTAYEAYATAIRLWWIDVGMSAEEITEELASMNNSIKENWVKVKGRPTTKEEERFVSGELKVGRAHPTLPSVNPRPDRAITGIYDPLQPEPMPKWERDLLRNVGFAITAISIAAGMPVLIGDTTGAAELIEEAGADLPNSFIKTQPLTDLDVVMTDDTVVETALDTMPGITGLTGPSGVFTSDPRSAYPSVNPLASAGTGARPPSDPPPSRSSSTVEEKKRALADAENRAAEYKIRSDFVEILRDSVTGQLPLGQGSFQPNDELKRLSAERDIKRQDLTDAEQKAIQDAVGSTTPPNAFGPETWDSIADIFTQAAEEAENAGWGSRAADIFNRLTEPVRRFFSRARVRDEASILNRIGQSFGEDFKSYVTNNLQRLGGGNEWARLATIISTIAMAYGSKTLGDWWTKEESPVGTGIPGDGSKEPSKDPTGGPSGGNPSAPSGAPDIDEAPASRAPLPFTSAPVNFVETGLLRPEMFEGGSVFVSEVNKDVVSNEIDSLMWGAFNNYDWEANTQNNNPLYIKNMTEYNLRMSAPFLGDDDLPAQMEEAAFIQEHADAALIPFQTTQSIQDKSTESFFPVVPNEGQAAESDVNQQMIKSESDVDKQFHPVFFPDWYSLGDDSIWRQMTASDGTQLPDSERLGNEVDSYWWQDNQFSNQFIFETTS